MGNGFKLITVTGAFYCLCGAQINFSGRPDDWARVGKLFLEAHTGEGHGSATKAQCRNARRRADTKLERQMQEERLF